LDIYDFLENFYLALSNYFNLQLAVVAPFRPTTYWLVVGRKGATTAKTLEGVS